jgi:hypothetical protein
MPPTEAIAGRPMEAHRCFNVAVVLAIETRIAVAIGVIEKEAVGIAVATKGEPWQYKALPTSLPWRGGSARR